jgi:hypothetical protein
MSTTAKLAKVLLQADAHERIKRVRHESSSLPAFRSRLRGEFAGLHCLVLGSAPTAKMAPHDKLLCVNGSSWVAKKFGLKPDLTVIAGWALRGNTPVQVATIDAMRGSRTRVVVLLESGPTEAEARRVLRQASCRFDELLKVDSLERAAIIGDVCGEDVPVGPQTTKHSRPSNGIFAVALALWAGASKVTLSGFSLKGGHAYIEGDTPRSHVEGDEWFLSCICDRKANVEILWSE